MEHIISLFAPSLLTIMMWSGFCFQRRPAIMVIAVVATRDHHPKAMRLCTGWVADDRQLPAEYYVPKWWLAIIITCYVQTENNVLVCVLPPKLGLSILPPWSSERRQVVPTVSKISNRCAARPLARGRIQEETNTSHALGCEATRCRVSSEAKRNEHFSSWGSRDVPESEHQQQGRHAGNPKWCASRHLLALHLCVINRHLLRLPDSIIGEYTNTK